MADDAKDEVEKAGEVKVMWRQGWLEHKVWGGGLSSRPSPLWPRREAPFSSAAACGSTVVETLRTKDKQRYYDIRGWPVMSTSAGQKKAPYVGCRTAWRWWGSSSSRTTRYTRWGVSWSTFQFCVRTAARRKWSSALRRPPGGTKWWRGCIWGGREED